MNYHSDKWVMERLFEHYNDAVEHFPRDRIVCLNLAGSQNYCLDTAGSDVDTKLVVVPSFKDVAMNNQPVSTTHVRQNSEHIGTHDIRLYIPTLKKCNTNFLETLFTKYTIVNPLYAYEWNRLVAAREEIARYDVARALQAMRGTMYTKYKLLFNNSDNRAEAITKFGYSPKELCAILRTEEFIGRYLSGEPYENCLKTRRPEYFKDVKAGHYDLDTARIVANSAMSNVERTVDARLAERSYGVNKEVSALMDDVQYNIMKIAMKKELGE